MKRTVKLSQSELVDIIKRVIEENSINKETLSEAAVVNGTTINSGRFLNTIVGKLKNNYKVTVSCGKSVAGIFVTAYEGPITIDKLWNGKDGGIAGKDNTGKIFTIPFSKASVLATKMKNGDKVIQTEGSGTIAGISGSCKVKLTKVSDVNEDELIPLIQNILQEQMEQDDILVDASEISLNDQKCFRDATESEINATFDGKPKKPKYKVKKKGCSTTVRYKGPKVKYYKNNGF